MAERADGDESGSLLTRTLAAIVAEIWSFAVFSFLAPRTNSPEHAPPSYDRGVTSLPKSLRDVDDPLETSRPTRTLERREIEGHKAGMEDKVSDKFLAQLEQRTQQVKITLANLQAEKIRIEEAIAQLQPIVPHYDALVAAERQMAEARIVLESTHSAVATPPAEGSGWSTEAPGGEAAIEPKNPGWSGSWNS